MTGNRQIVIRNFLVGLWSGGGGNGTRNRAEMRIIGLDRRSFDLEIGFLFCFDFDLVSRVLFSIGFVFSVVPRIHFGI